jgi:hypothetical protein
MDFIDLADQANELLLASQINAARTTAQPLPAVGVCHWCHARLEPGLRFCDQDCSDDHATRQRADAIAGRR